MVLSIDGETVVELFDEKVRAVRNIAVLDKAMQELLEVVDTLEYIRGQLTTEHEPDPFGHQCPNEPANAVQGPTQAFPANDPN